MQNANSSEILVYLLSFNYGIVYQSCWFYRQAAVAALSLAPSHYFCIILRLDKGDPYSIISKNELYQSQNRLLSNLYQYIFLG